MGDTIDLEEATNTRQVVQTDKGQRLASGHAQQHQVHMDFSQAPLTPDEAERVAGMLNTLASHAKQQKKPKGKGKAKA